MTLQTVKFENSYSLDYLEDLGDINSQGPAKTYSYAKEFLNYEIYTDVAHIIIFYAIMIFLAIFILTLLYTENLGLTLIILMVTYITLGTILFAIYIWDIGINQISAVLTMIVLG